MQQLLDKGMHVIYNNKSCELDCNRLTPELVTIYRTILVDVEKIQKIINKRLPRTSSSCQLGPSKPQMQASRVGCTASLYEGEVIAGTTCLNCVWCRADPNFYLDPLHKFQEVHWGNGWMIAEIPIHKSFII